MYLKGKQKRASTRDQLHCTKVFAFFKLFKKPINLIDGNDSHRGRRWIAAPIEVAQVVVDRAIEILQGLVREEVSRLRAIVRSVHSDALVNHFSCLVVLRVVDLHMHAGCGANREGRWWTHVDR